MSKTFFIGCTHFGHSNIIKLANRPFQNVDQMDRTLIDNWNSVVKPEDEVWVLGDFAYKSANPVHYFSQLNGRKHLIIGNHDHDDTLRLKWVSKQHYKELRVDAIKLILFHYPILEWNGAFRDVLHLHAHTHNSARLDGKDRFADSRVNVTVESWNYTPVELQDLLAWHNAA